MQKNCVLILKVNKGNVRRKENEKKEIVDVPVLEEVGRIGEFSSMPSNDFMNGVIAALQSMHHNKPIALSIETVD